MSKHGILIKSEDVLEEKYKVLDHIASGGMSEVYLVEEVDKHNPQRWAVKVANKDNKLSQKLIDETKILSELEHPNIPRIIDFFSTEDYIFLVMEYAAGEVLTEYLNENDYKLPLTAVIELGIQLCDILEYLHNRSEPIIYRDIKPGNIIMKKNGEMKLIDFGISRKFREEKLRDTVKIGTVGFAAPEQFEQKQTDQRTDLFSMGALLYYILSQGKYVYIAQKPISHYSNKLPKSLIKCINQLVELEPNKRLQHASDAKKLLVKALNETNRKGISIYVTLTVGMAILVFMVGFLSSFILM
ncbi:protein kinase [Ornithinibacillus sp. L9]|uniref:non-specific serine/threonine protein kinase n=1 Tax=Ornithinibacillus caprae TaxID=2678566 RepID=A0A6N8FFM2_9BACI|nr:serine/threonine-protein kinase [Ornithinibacillus caprae]MUK87044.1 protein kinase [Ornithinibacillus caprae]